MIVVIQRVSSASVEIDSGVKSSRLTASSARTTTIGKGLLVLVGVEDADTDEDIEWLSGKVVNLRIFNDAEGVMNVSVRDDGGEVLVVSQFTLHASTKKGNRPSYIKASKPEIAIPMYGKFVQRLAMDLGKEIQTGEFGADMKVSLLNDGPVTIVIDSKDRK